MWTNDLNKHTKTNLLHTFALSSSIAPCVRIWKNQTWELNQLPRERVQVNLFFSSKTMQYFMSETFFVFYESFISKEIQNLCNCGFFSLRDPKIDRFTRWTDCTGSWWRQSVYILALTIHHVCNLERDKRKFRNQTPKAIIITIELGLLYSDEKSRFWERQTRSFWAAQVCLATQTQHTVRAHLFFYHAVCGAGVRNWLSNRWIVSHPGTTDRV